MQHKLESNSSGLFSLAQSLLQGGGKASAALHVTRTVCRRAERAVVSLAADGHVPAVVATYLNRLSDFMFVSARFAALQAAAPEVVYKKVRA